MFITRMAIATAMGVLLYGGAAFAAVPDDGGTRPTFELARSLIDAEQFEKAVAVLKKLDTDDVTTAAQIDLLFGRIYLAINKPAKALDYFEHASFSSLDVEAEAYLGLAEAKLALGDLTQARKNATMAMKSDPDLVTAHLAIADQRVGRGAEAMARLHQLQQQRPDDEDVAVVLARYIANQEGAGRGAAELETFVDRVPTAAAAQDALGQMLWASGRKKDAVMARILAKELYEARNQTGRAEAMAAWLKAVDPKGQYELTLKTPELPPPPPKSEHQVTAVPKTAPPTEAAPVPPVQNQPRDEPPPPAAAPRPTVKAMPIAIALPHPEPLPFAPGSQIKTGSGIVLEGGRLIITNRHVVEGMNTVAVRNGTGHVRDARIVKISADDDLALLEIDKPFPEGAVVPISDIVDPAPGRAAIVMGFPLISILGDEQPALTEGIVAKTVGLGNDPNTFQMTTKINQGNSGGPVFDKRGHLLGVAVGKTDTAGIYQKSGVLVEDMNIGIKGGRILAFLGKPHGAEANGPEMSLEDLYQEMLPRAVLIAAQK
jgi:tetratricopeptide (TPR) repeat protein